jgi:prevent-host-death family protein
MELGGRSAYPAVTLERARTAAGKAKEKKAMLDIAKDIQSLSHFKRNTAEVMKQLKASGNPVVLTVNCKAEVVVQDAAAYQRLMDLAEKAEMIEFLREARADADEGRKVPAGEFLQSLGQKKKAKKA